MQKCWKIKEYEKGEIKEMRIFLMKMQQFLFFDKSKMYE